ncbi:pyridoxamine 5'-phosphate oxidase family protein [Microbulbifer hainanensis]|uniref:pyridoxamine 5'-phosphate oxidase family protein n=1 Tax=Microbulbifer hainanensis TaxID=2735675 RepID=UPI0018690832|nr:pyridoxamine 5'-phosphate oxidase family protein [Microbulbifer hainanensis]
MYIESEENLRELYGFPKGRAKDKQLNALEKHAINFIEHSPFALISTYGKSGLADCSPRGGSPGFAKVINPGCIVIPDAKGNNRLDSLINIIHTGNIGCLFLIPGVDETLRINGVARISTDSNHLSLFTPERNPPKTCIELTVKEVFLHCAKALMRSKLWDPECRITRSSFPTMGAMINDQLALNEVPESQEDMIERYKNEL